MTVEKTAAQLSAFGAIELLTLRDVPEADAWVVAAKPGTRWAEPLLINLREAVRVYESPNSPWTFRYGMLTLANLRKMEVRSSALSNDRLAGIFFTDPPALLGTSSNALLAIGITYDEAKLYNEWFGAAHESVPNNQIGDYRAMRASLEVAGRQLHAVLTEYAVIPVSDPERSSIFQRGFYA
jgi:hypothetical protein